MKELAFALTYAIPAALAAIGAGIVGAALMAETNLLSGADA